MDLLLLFTRAFAKPQVNRLLGDKLEALPIENPWKIADLKQNCFELHFVNFINYVIPHQTPSELNSSTANAPRTSFQALV